MTTATEERRLAPRVDVLEDNEGVTIFAEFPGVPKDGAEVEVRDGHLILKGKRHTNGDDGRYRVRERFDADFYRTFALSDAVDTEKVDAELRDGVLTVRVPKSERLRARQIVVN